MIGRFIDGQLKKHLAKYVDGSFESSFNQEFGEEARRWLIAPEVDPETWRIEDR